MTNGLRLMYLEKPTVRLNRFRQQDPHRIKIFCVKSAALHSIELHSDWLLKEVT